MAFLDENGLAELWSILKKKTIPRVGDIKITARTDMGDNWVLANGASFARAKFPELFELTMAGSHLYDNIAEKTLSHTGEVGHKVYNKNAFVCYPLPNNWVYSDSIKISLIDLDTLEVTTIPGSAICTVTNTRLLGIDWDGARWVACTWNSGTGFSFYVSSNFTAWSLANTVANPNSNLTVSTVYCKSDFIFDGVRFITGMARNGTQAFFPVFVTKDLSKVSAGDSITVTNSWFTTSGDGLVAIVRYYSSSRYTQCYRNGTLVCNLGFSYVGVAKMSDTCYLFAPQSSDQNVSEITIYKPDVGLAYLLADNVTGERDTYFRRFWFDPEENKWMFEFYSDETRGYFLYSLPYGADPMTASNYTAVKTDYSSSQSGDSFYTGNCFADNHLLYQVSSKELYSLGYKTHVLPTVTAGTGAYAYVKVKE